MRSRPVESPLDAMSRAGRHGPRLPPGLPFPPPLSDLVAWRWPLWYFDRSRARVGTQFTLRTTGHPPLVFLAAPDDVRQMLQAPADVLHPGEGGAPIMPIVGPSSFMMLDEDEHLRGRQIVSPAFRARMRSEHAEIAASVARRAISSWPREVAFPMLSYLRELTLEVILRVSLSPHSDRELMILRDRLLALMDINASPMLTEAILRRGPGRVRWRRFLRDRAEVDRLLLARIEARSRSGELGDDVLGLLLAARHDDGSALASTEVRDNLMSIILAGHETTASQLCWTFQLLAHSPDAQATLADEVDKGMETTFLRATVDEAMRHRPVFFYTIPRAVVQPVEIGGRMFEPPAHLLGSIYSLHHDPELWGDPDRFRPERFAGGQPAPGGWLPWGGGRKTCPGQHLAVVEMENVLSAVVCDLKVIPASRSLERPRWRGVIVTPYRGGRVTLTRRTKAARRGQTEKSP